jgi:site-specific DNA-methyltransferase (adenine-specific)
LSIKNIVHLIDCVEFMRGLPDKAYDLAIVDPPYGIKRDGMKKSTSSHGGRKAYDFKGWDEKIPDEKYFIELMRISKNQIIFGANYFTKYLPPSMGWLYWNKGQAGMLGSSDGELAFSSFQIALREILINRVELLKEGTIHPVQKPILLYKWLLKNYAKPGQTIFDSHVGSGSSRIACYDMGFDFTGCELDADYYAAQEKRFADHIAQLDLFPKDEIQTEIYREKDLI